MIYIIPTLLIFCLFLRYDLGNNQKGKMEWYYILLVLFVTIGGFEYNVGSDMPGYMYEYDSFNWNSIHSICDLTEFRHRQPGWVLLNLIFKSISSDFALLQFFNALFFNTVFFIFIRKNSKYFFLTLLFYTIVIYLNLNFNILRQGYAICFFLIGYEYLKKNKILIYYLFAALAFSFHTSALILFVVPLFMLVKFNKKALILSGIALLVVLYAALNGMFESILTSFFSDMVFEDGSLQNIGEAGEKFMGAQYEREGSITLFGMLEKMISIGWILFVMIYYSRKNKDTNSWSGILLLYAICAVMDLVIPVMFFRFLYYFHIFFYCSFAYCIVDISMRLSRSKLVTAIVCVLFMITPIRTLLSVNPSSGIPMINQFYPYHSIFDKEIDPVRAANFGSHK